MTPEEIAALQAEHAKLAKRVAELEPDAATGKAQREANEKAVGSAIAKLGKDDRAIVEALPSAELQLKAIAKLTATPTMPNPGNPGGPPSTSSVSFDEAWGTPEWEAVRSRNPKAADAWFSEKAYGAPSGAKPPLQFIARPLK